MRIDTKIELKLGNTVISFMPPLRLTLVCLKIFHIAMKIYEVEIKVVKWGHPWSHSKMCIFYVVSITYFGGLLITIITECKIF